MLELSSDANMILFYPQACPGSWSFVSPFYRRANRGSEGLRPAGGLPAGKRPHQVLTWVLCPLLQSPHCPQSSRQLTPNQDARTPLTLRVRDVLTGTRFLRAPLPWGGVPQISRKQANSPQNQQPTDLTHLIFK